MKLIEILSPSCTLCNAPMTSKKRILEEICSLVVKSNPALDVHDLLESLLEREKMGSTGIGNGIAIPHGRLAEAEQAIAVLVTTQEPIDFDAIDNKKVDIFIALFVPAEACDDHLSTLQSIAKLFSQTETGRLIRKCQNDDELFTLVKQLSE